MQIIILDTLVYYLFFILFIISTIGYGIFFKNHVFKDKTKTENIFKYFFLGIIILFPLSFINYFIISYIAYTNIFIVIFGAMIFINNNFKDLNKILLVTFIFFSGTLISKTHEDFSVYHFQHIKEISDYYIKFGLANLDERYIYSSSFAYLQALTKIPYYELKLINIPTFAVFLSLIGYLTLELKKRTQTKQFILLFFLVFLIIKYKRFSEFGYDYPGQFILIFLFLEYIYVIKKNNIFSDISLYLIYLTTLLIKVTNIYFAPVIIYYFIIQKSNFKKYIINKKFITFSLVILITFSFNSFLKTGCGNYLIKQTCLSKEKVVWSINYHDIQNTKIITRNWARGFYHQKVIKLDEINYNNSFNWFPNWFNVHFKVKILPFLIIVLLLFFIIKFINLNNNSIKYKEDNKNMLNIACLFSLFIWLINFPQARFGFFMIILIFYLILKKLFGDSNKIKSKKGIILFIIAIMYFNISNFIRINTEFSRNDVYKFNNFPWIPEPQFKFKKEETNNKTIYRSQDNKKFWRTCWNAQYICINHDDPVNFYFSNRFIFIEKKY